MLRSMKYGLYGAVLAGLVAAPAVWNSVDKTVHLVVDGKTQTMQTTAQDVGQVLRARGLKVTPHDLLAPSASSSVDDGSRIVLRRGRLLHLDVDGRRTDVWTTAPTVSEALAQLGYSSSDFVSVSRARRLPLTATDIAIRTPRLITVVHDGRRDQVTTTDATVGEVLRDLNITVSASDRLSVPREGAVTAGQVVRIQRVLKKLLTRIEALPFPTSRQQDSSLFTGTTKLVRNGQKGKAQVTYAVVYVDGKIVGQTKVKMVTVAAPKAKVLKVGTKHIVTDTRASGGGATVPSAPAPSPGTAKAIARELLAKRGWGATQYDCLVTLWNHESGWRVDAANPSGAYGIPQALPGSKMASAGPDWQNNAGTQIQWGLGYIASRYGTPCGAWSSWQAQGGWY
ncbi:MAG: resuscitation-promoting factor RpfB [Pseudonocardiales bacterium]|nr:resuscitation-promoting factor RpfB [Pseudonocardiales bacterium]